LTLIQTPFPRPYYKTYAIAALVTGFCVAFILTVFQPFGTSSFEHEYKFWILSGYGVVIAIAILLYYYLSLRFIHKRRLDDWTVLYEVLDYFVCAVFAMTCTYLYFINIFDYSFSGEGLFGFLKVATAVNMLPMIALGSFMYSQYRGVIRSQMELEHQDISKEEVKLTLTGTNKSESVKASSGDIVLVKAEDNYVIIHLLKEEKKLAKHMIRSTLKDMLAQLPSEQFYQCHRSYIINKSRVIELIGNKNSLW